MSTQKTEKPEQRHRPREAKGEPEDEETKKRQEKPRNTKEKTNRKKQGNQKSQREPKPEKEPEPPVPVMAAESTNDLGKLFEISNEGFILDGRKSTENMPIFLS